MLFIILHRLRLGTRIAIWLTLLLLGTTAAKAQTETVKLKNGKTYEVRTKHGLPLGFESNQIKVTNVGITGSTQKSDKTQFLWFLSAELREKGKFVVTVTTPLDETISTTFECKGRGKIFQTFLGSAEYPALWALLEEPGTTWIPFVFSFEDKGSGKKFEATQWAKFDSATMKEMRELIKRAEESIRSTERQKKPEGSLPEEKLVVDFDKREWRVGYSADQAEVRITEYVLPGETVHNWTELVTIQVLPGAQKGRTAEELMLSAREVTLKRCGKTMWNVLHNDENQVLYEWETVGCSGFDNQYEVAKIIRGRTAIHRVSYTNKKLPTGTIQ